jgi:hypothetical protein
MKMPRAGSIILAFVLGTAAPVMAQQGTWEDFQRRESYERTIQGLDDVSHRLRMQEMQQRDLDQQRELMRSRHDAERLRNDFVVDQAIRDINRRRDR